MISLKLHGVPPSAGGVYGSPLSHAIVHGKQSNRFGASDAIAAAAVPAALLISALVHAATAPGDPPRAGQRAKSAGDTFKAHVQSRPPSSFPLSYGFSLVETPGGWRTPSTTPEPPRSRATRRSP